MSLYVQSPLGALVSQEESVALRNLAAMAADLENSGIDEAREVASKFFTLLSKTADDLMSAHTKLSGDCGAHGETGEYDQKA